jgi:hypothetical protein
MTDGARRFAPAPYAYCLKGQSSHQPFRNGERLAFRNGHCSAVPAIALGAGAKALDIKALDIPFRARAPEALCFLAP